MGKVTKEQASKEVAEWLDFKKVSTIKRTKQEDSIETIAGAIEDGYLVLNEDKSFTQTLRFPNDITGEKVNYKTRISDDDVKIHLRNVKPMDVDGRIAAHISGLTSLGSGILSKIDSEDKAIMHAIVAFFL